MIHFKRFKQARFISCRKGSDIYKIVQHFGSFFFIHSAKRISRLTCRRCVHRKAERSARRLLYHCQSFSRPPMILKNKGALWKALPWGQSFINNVWIICVISVD